MDNMIKRTVLNSVEFKTTKGENLRIRFNSQDDYSVENNVTNNLLLSYEYRMKSKVTCENSTYQL